MKKCLNAFFRSFGITFVVSSCILAGLISSAMAYEAIQLTGFGRHRSAIEITDTHIRIFDLEIEKNRANGDT